MLNQRELKDALGDDFHLEPLILPESPKKAVTSETRLIPLGWPSGPSTIRLSRVSLVLDIFVDAVLLLLSVAFFIFALAVYCYNNASVDDHPKMTSALLELAKYGPTIFPILFASVFSRFTFALLVWKLECGERIGVLDLLAGSTSLTSTVVSQLRLGVLSVLGLCLIGTWSLSPIGGQASFRQITSSVKIDTAFASFDYFQISDNTGFYGSSERVTFFALPNSLFMTTLYSKHESKVATVDPWGNVKIPLIESYESSLYADEQGWFTRHESYNYSSLVGLPISRINGSLENSELRVETEYLYLDCPLVIPNVTMNSSRVAPEGATTGDGAWILSDYNYTQNATNTEPDMLKPRWLVYGDWYNNPQWSMGNGGLNGSINCTVTTTYVEAEIDCDGSAVCAVSRFRRSQMEHLPRELTLLGGDYTTTWTVFVGGFLGAIPGHPLFPNAVTYYLNDPESIASYSRNLSMTGPDMWPPVSKRLFAERLTQIFNTYWTCINARNNIALASAKPVGNDTLFNTTSGRKYTHISIVKAHIGWIIILCIASLLMISANLVRFVIRHNFSRSGDSLMLNFSSLAVKDNPYVLSSIPMSGSFMTAGERAKLLKDFRIRLGDVKGDAETGRLAIGSIDGENEIVSIERIRKGRWYE